MREPARWVWVTRPAYYLAEGGGDAPALDPAAGFVADGWWTCHHETRAGDLVLLYRAGVRKDISHFLVARSDAELLDDPASEFDGAHVCQYEVLAKFARPLPYAQLTSDAMLATWHPVAIRMHGRAFPVPTPIWQRLGALVDADFDALARQAADGLHRIRLERQLEQRLIDQPRLLASAGLRNLTLHRQQLRLPTGRIADLVYRQRRLRGSRLVVIELKKIKAGPRAVTQLLDYRHTLDRQRRPLRPRTLAVLIADGITANAAQLAADHRVTIIPLGHLGITVAKPSTR